MLFRSPVDSADFNSTINNLLPGVSNSDEFISSSDEFLSGSECPLDDFSEFEREKITDPVLLIKFLCFKTAFACDLGLFEWRLMPLGFCNATATFQRIMAKSFKGIEQREGSLVMSYVDDVT